MAKLSEQDKGKIIADRLSGLSFRELASKYEVSTTTIQRIVNSDTEMSRKVTEKKNQDTADMIAFMDSRKEKAQSVLDAILEEMSNPVTIKTAKLSEMATAFGIVIDKFVTNPQKHALDRQKLETELIKLESQLKENASEEAAEDNFMEAMNGYSEDVWKGEGE